MGRSTFTFTSTPYPKDVIALGTLIPDKRYPNLDAFPNPDVKPEDISSGDDKNFDAYLHAGSETSFQGMLGKIFTFGTTASSNETHRFTSDEAQMYFLKRPRDVFKALCAKEEVRKWLEEERENEAKTYFIIGYRTLTNAKLVDESSRSRGVDAKVQIPAGTLIGIDPAMGGAADVGGSGTHERTEERSENYECSGERIYAVCYRKVKLKTVKGQFEGARLGKDNEWTSYQKNRSGTTVTSADLDEDVSEDEEVVRNWELGEEDDVFEALDPM
jgi:hypothetical protein